MAGTKVQLRRGTTTQHSSFTGAVGEVTVDTTKKTLVVHDGSTAGGFPVIAQDASGNVGIGTSSPGEKLDVAGAIKSNNYIAIDRGTAGQPSLNMFGSNNQTYGGAAIYLRNGSSGTGYPTSGTGTGTIFFGNGNYGASSLIAGYAAENQSSSAAGGVLTFSTTATGSTSSTERMRIDSNGNVGIGAASSGGRLEISKSAPGADSGCYISNTASTGRAVFGAGADLSGSTVYAGLVADATADYCYIYANTDLGFSAGSSYLQKFLIGGTGNFSRVIPGGSGMYPDFCARAWVNFNGTGTVSIRASGNVSSITDLGVGNYYANLTTAMPDTSYCINTTANGASMTGETATAWVASATYFGIETYVGTTGTDMGEVFASVFR